jgi:type I restriction enzyme M protein
MPHGVLFRGSSEKVIREGLLKDDLIEAVIGLASNLFYGAGIPTAIIIINKKKPKNRKNKVLFINAELEYEEGKAQNYLRDEHLEKIIDTYENYKELRRFSRIVDISEIKENDWNLNIRRYADTSPPPEQFDVKAVLNGGIPVSEIEDVYIQETLQGCDLKCVFDKMNKDYYKFKDKIKSKEDIAEFAKELSPEVISQIEHWWDKYKVTLKDIEAEFEEADKAMKKYLKELGYE